MWTPQATSDTAVAPPGAEQIFSGEGSALGVQGDVPSAQARSVARALHALGSSHPNVFYYSGHAGGAGDLDSGLVLKDGLSGGDADFEVHGPDRRPRTIGAALAGPRPRR